MKTLVLIFALSCTLGILLQKVVSEEPVETAVNTVNDEQSNDYGAKKERMSDDGSDVVLNNNDAPAKNDVAEEKNVGGADKEDNDDEDEVDEPDETAVNPVDDENSYDSGVKEESIVSSDGGFEVDLKEDEVPKKNDVEDEEDDEDDEEDFDDVDGIEDPASIGDLQEDPIPRRRVPKFRRFRPRFPRPRFPRPRFPRPRFPRPRFPRPRFPRPRFRPPRPRFPRPRFPRPRFPRPRFPRPRFPRPRFPRPRFPRPRFPRPRFPRPRIPRPRFRPRFPWRRRG